MTPQEQPQHECRCEFCKERLCNGECVFGLRINPPQPSKEGEVREKIRKIMVEDKLEGATIGKTETALLNLFQSLLKEERRRYDKALRSVAQAGDDIAEMAGYFISTKDILSLTNYARNIASIARASLTHDTTQE